MIIDITVTLLTATATATAVNDIAVTVVLNDEVVNPEETFCERVDACLDIPSTNGNYVLNVLNGVKSWVAASASATWGSITGTITNQTDLVNYITTRLTGYATEAFVTSQGYITNVVTALGYTPEDVANKTDTMSGNTTSSTKYLSAKGVYDWVIGLGYQVALTAANFGSFINGLTGKTTPVDADYLSLWDSVSQTAQKLSWANLKATLLTYFDTIFQRKHVIAKSTVISTHTGNTAETKVTSVRIAGGTYSAGDIIKIYARDIKTGTAGAWTPRIRIGTADDLSGTIIFAVTNTASVVNDSCIKTGVVRDISTDTQFGGTTVRNDDAFNGTGANFVSYSFNWANDIWIVFSVQNNNSGDTSGNYSYIITKE